MKKTPPPERKALIPIAMLMMGIAIVGLSGCESVPKGIDHGSVVQTAKDGTRTENLSDYAAFVAAKKDLATKPLFEMSCPATGCLVLSLKVNNPNGGGDIAAPAAPPKVESTGVGIAREMKETVGLLMPLGMVGLVGSTVSKVFNSFGNTTQALAAKIQAPQPNVTTTNTASGGSAIGGSATTTPTTTSTTTTNTNSGNTSLNCASGAATGGTTTAQGAPSGAVTCR